MDDHTAAQEMLKLIAQAPMSDRVRSAFMDLAERGHPRGIFQKLSGYIETRGDVGASVEKSGLVSFESVFPQVEAIYEEWRKGK